MTEEKIREKLNECILKSGYKHSFIAEKLGIIPSNFSLSLNGKRKWTNAEFLGLCLFFNLDVKDFI